MKKLIIATTLFLSSLPVFAQTTVTGNVEDILGGNLTPTNSTAFVRFRLRNFSGFAPRTNGAGSGVCAGTVFVSTQKDVSPNGSGAISTTLCGNDVISPANTYYTLEFWTNGKMQTSQNFQICGTPSTCGAPVGGSFNFNTATPLASPPVPSPINFFVAMNPGAGVNQTIVQQAGTSLNVTGGNGFNLNTTTFTGVLGLGNGGTGNTNNYVVGAPIYSNGTILTSTSANTNGVAYSTGSVMTTTTTGGGGTLALCSTNGGAPFWSNCTSTGTGTPLISNTANPASAGAIRLAHPDAFNFRNNLNTLDVNGLSIGGGNDVVTVGGSAGVIIGSGNTTIATNGGNIVLNASSANSLISAAVGAHGIFEWTLDTASDSAFIIVGSGGNSFTMNPTKVTSQVPLIMSNTQIALAGGTTNISDKFPSPTAFMGLTLKKGSGGVNYSSASTTYVRVDSTNLAFTVTVPTGWKLAVTASGNITTLTAAIAANVALADGTSDNSGILVEGNFLPQAAGVTQFFALNWVVAGDGASHTINLQYKTSNGADSVQITNTSATFLPTMVFTLMPSN